MQEIVQKLETEPRANKQARGDPMVAKLRETENFFTMVRKFFIEHEALKDYAQNCLHDLLQLQRYFQVRPNSSCPTSIDLLSNSLN